MTNDMLSLEAVIDTICRNSDIHVCIHDVTGILNNPMLKIGYGNQTHAKHFCDLAKTTKKGYDLCIKCKIKANNKAIKERIPFGGYCPNGLYEIVKPVVIDEKTACIIYLGNMIQNKEYTMKRIAHTCTFTKSPKEKMLLELAHSQVVTDTQHYIDVANLIDSYLQLLYHHYGYSSNGKCAEYHYAVKELLTYCKLNYDKDIKLQTMAKLYYINEKYMGKLFKDQTGYSFHQYLNLIRLEKAAFLLQNSNDSVISIAIQCGFNNVTYFNRVFRSKYNLSPTKYRESQNINP